MQFLQKYRHFFLVATCVLIWLIGMVLRSTHLNAFQRVRFDEEVWVISGASLIQTGIPKSWTVFWDTYPTYFADTIGGEVRVYVQPFLDHPPLFQVLIGSWAVITGNTGAAAFNWIELRMPMIVIAGVTIIATTLLSRELFGKKTAVFVLLFYAFLPSHVLAARIIAVEHLFAVLLILQLLFFVWYQRIHSKRARRLLLSLNVMIAMAAPLLKLSGIAISLIPVVLYASYKKYSAAALCGAATLIGLLIYVGYGMYFDTSLFTAVQQAHSERPQTFWYFFTLFDRPNLGYFTLEDPLFILGLFGSLLVLWQQHTDVQKRNARILLVPWLLCMCIFLAIAPVELYGWYKFMIIPLIAIGGGYLIAEFLSEKMEATIFILPSLLMLWQQTSYGFTDSVLLKKPLLILTASPILLFVMFPILRTRWYRIWATGIIIFLLFFAAAWSTQLVTTV